MTNIKTYPEIYQDIIYEIPSTCPHCGKEMASTIVQVKSIKLSDTLENKILLAKCGICRHYFALEYIYSYRLGNEQTKLITYDYSPKIEVSIPKQINLISENFSEIYTESETAYQLSLFHVAGMGFRKATEQLVKDYLIYKGIGESENIYKFPLKQAINKLDNDKIKTLALACAYIGNDYAHLQKRNEDKDITDLKNFIDALIHYLSFEINVDQASKMIDENWLNGSYLPIQCPSL